LRVRGYCTLSVTSVSITCHPFTVEIWITIVNTLNQGAPFEHKNYARFRLCPRSLSFKRVARIWFHREQFSTSNHQLNGFAIYVSNRGHGSIETDHSILCGGELGFSGALSDLPRESPFAGVSLCECDLEVLINSQGLTRSCQAAHVSGRFSQHCPCQCEILRAVDLCDLVYLHS